MCICVGKFSYNIRILSQKFHLASANICSLTTRIPSSLDFLMIFVAWRSPPSVDFARVLSTKSAKKHGFRARSDYSLLPKNAIDKAKKVVKHLVAVDLVVHFVPCPLVKLQGHVTARVGHALGDHTYALAVITNGVHISRKQQDRQLFRYRLCPFFAGHGF